MVPKFVSVACRNMMNVAAQCYKATISVTTGLSAPYNNLAIIHKQQVNLELLNDCIHAVKAFK